MIQFLTVIRLQKENIAYRDFRLFRAADDEAETLEIVLKDDLTQVEIHLLYGVLEDADIITRSVVIKNTGTETITVKKALSACLDFVTGRLRCNQFLWQTCYGAQSGTCSCGTWNVPDWQSPWQLQSSV